MTKEAMQTANASFRVYASRRLYFHILALLVTIQIQDCSSARRHPTSPPPHPPHRHPTTPPSHSYTPHHHPTSPPPPQVSEESPFRLPQPPIPTYPQGDTGFGRGNIDLGGLTLYEAQNFKKVWAINEGGYDDSGTSFYEPDGLPDAYYLLGHTSQPNAKPIYSSVLVAQDTTGNPLNSALAKPINYTIIWSSVGVTMNKDGEGYIWQPVPPDGYLPVGQIVTKSPEMPSVDMMRVVRADFTASLEADQWIWGKDGFNMNTMKPCDRGAGSLSVPVGTFMAAGPDCQVPPTSLVCLKRPGLDDSHMPTIDQVQAMLAAYAPVVYFHADEQYLPSTVDWFFQNGALLYRNGNETGELISPNGENLPGRGSVDDFYLDLPADEAAGNKLKGGELQDAKAYVHIKTAFGGTYTDLAIWLFYPFNGPIKFQLGPITLRLKKIGQHVADWEHLTLRVDNFNGGLKSMYLSEHSKGIWMNAMELEYENDGSNKPIVYAALHSHAFYPHQGHFIHTKEMAAMPSPGIVTNSWFGPRNDTGTGSSVMDIGKQFEILRFVNENGILAQPWLFYPGRWGPKKAYSLQKMVEFELDNEVKLLPAGKRDEIRDILFKLPPELFGEEGPQGPMMKDDWGGDEKI